MSLIEYVREHWKPLGESVNSGVVQIPDSFNIESELELSLKMDSGIDIRALTPWKAPNFYMASREYFFNGRMSEFTKASKSIGRLLKDIAKQDNTDTGTLWAFSDNMRSNLVSINEALIIRKTTKNLFWCSCGAQKRSYKQGINGQIAHFKHVNNDDNIGCASRSETNVHNLGKVILQTMITDKKPFRLPPVYGKTTEGEPFVISPAQDYVFKSCSIEKLQTLPNGDSFKPDAILFSGKNHTGQPLFIEIKVTHGVDDDKQLKIEMFGVSCIEISLSKKMTDLEIQKAVISTYSNKEWIYNPKFNTPYDASKHEIKSGNVDSESRADSASPELCWKRVRKAVDSKLESANQIIRDSVSESDKAEIERLDSRIRDLRESTANRIVEIGRAKTEQTGPDESIISEIKTTTEAIKHISIKSKNNDRVIKSQNERIAILNREWKGSITE